MNNLVIMLQSLTVLLRNLENVSNSYLFWRARPEGLTAQRKLISIKSQHDLFCESNDAFAGVHDFEHHTLTVVNNKIVHMGKQRKYTSDNKIDEKVEM